MPQQPWTDEVWEDSDGGRVVLHGTLPTVVYPNAMRPRLAFHGLALLESPDVVDLWVQEEKDEAESQGRQPYPCASFRRCIRKIR